MLHLINARLNMSTAMCPIKTLPRYMYPIVFILRDFVLSSKAEDPIDS
jgi:hypothetical protein